MRAKIIIPVMSFATLILALAGFVRFGSSPASQQTAGVMPVSQAAVSRPPVNSIAAPRPLAGLPANYSTRNDPYPDTSVKSDGEYSTNRVEELHYLATTGDANALRTILSGLSDGDPEIRRAALAGAVEFGNRSAIPALNDAFISNPDPQEQVKIQKAITYLQLPTVEEMDHNKAGLTAASGETSPR